MEQNFWDQTAKDYAAGRTKGREYILDPALLKIIGNVRGKKVLDIGCGAGSIMISLTKRGAVCMGIDQSSQLITEGKHKAKELGLSIDFRTMDARSIGTIRKRFNLVVIAVLLCHLSTKKDMGKVIKQSARLLPAGGKLIVGEPHPVFDFYMRNRLKTGDFEYFKSGLPYEFTMDIYGKNLNSVAYHWTLQDYISIITANGFQISKVIEPEPIKENKKVHENWYKEKIKYPSYIIFDCIKQ